MEVSWGGGYETDDKSFWQPGRSRPVPAAFPGCCDQSHLSDMGLAEDTVGTQSPVCVPGPGIKARTGRSSASGSGKQSLKEAKVKAG